MTVWILLAAYLIGFLFFSRASEFDEPGKLGAGLLWPAFLTYMLWRLWTKQATIRWHGRIVYPRSRRNGRR